MGQDRSNGSRDFPVEHVYLARPKLAQAVLEWWRRRRQLLADVQQWNDAHPGVPDLQLWHAADSHDLSVVGFRADEGDAEPPSGLSGTAFWEPADGPAGDRWRDLLRPPRVRPRSMTCSGRSVWGCSRSAAGRTVAR